MKLGLIGFGRLGEFIATFLSQDFDLSVFDTDADVMIKAKNMNIKFSPLSEIADNDAIIICTPISKTEDTIKELAKHIKGNPLIIDTCSVKELPVKWMQKHLPSQCSILATHPMFGPDSAKETLLGAKIVLSPIRIEDHQFNEIKSYLNSHGLRIIETTPKDHDIQISHSLLLTHFIGRSLIDFNAEQLLIDTKGYRRLMNILKTVKNDSFQLFLDMNKYNPYTKKTLNDFLKSMKKIQKIIEL